MSSGTGELTKSRLANMVFWNGFMGLQDSIKSEKWCGRHFGLSVYQHWEISREAFESIEGPHQEKSGSGSLHCRLKNIGIRTDLREAQDRRESTNAGST